MCRPEELGLPVNSPQALDQIPLHVICHEVLGAEEEDAALRNWSVFSVGDNIRKGCMAILLIARSHNKSSTFGALIQSVNLAVELSSDIRRHVDLFELIKRSEELLRLSMFL